MFRWVAAIRVRKLQKQVIEFGDVNDSTWPEYKALFIEMLKMATKADMNCQDEILYWNMQAVFRNYQHMLKGTFPQKYITDLFVTLRNLSREHNPELWAMLDNIDDTKP